MIRAACAVLLLACQVALAQDPPANTNQQAKDLSQRLGRERSVEGLEAIIEARNVDLLIFYERGFRETTMRLYTERRGHNPLPAGIEALMVRHYRDPRIGGALRILCASNGTRYQTRELFDLFLEEWRSGKVRPSTYPMRDSALNTDASGVEAPLLEWLQARAGPAGDDAGSVVRFLAARKYLPAIPALVALQKGAQSDAARHAAAALLEMGGAQIVAPILERLGWLRAQPSNAETTRELTFLAQRIAALPLDTPVDYATFRKALPEVMSDELKASVVAFARNRTDARAAPDLLRLLADPKQFQPALAALVDLDSPDLWRQARAEIERLKRNGEVNDGAYRYAAAMLDAKIADPQKHFAEKRLRDRQKAFEARKAPFDAQRNALHRLREADPERYLASMLEELRRVEPLVAEYADLPVVAGLRSEIGDEYLRLGHLARFRLKQPERSLELYAQAGRNGSPLGALGVADTCQFDLRDKARALAEFRRMLEAARQAKAPANRSEAALAEWARHWLDHQVRFLETGKPFAGSVGRDELEAAGMILFMGAGRAGNHEFLDLGAGTERKAVARKLEALPPSAFTLMSTAALASLLPDSRSILAYLLRHDPAGFATASLFAIVDLVDRDERGSRLAEALPGLVEPAGPANPMREAKTRFLRERRIDIRR